MPARYLHQGAMETALPHHFGDDIAPVVKRDFTSFDGALKAALRDNFFHPLLGYADVLRVPILRIGHADLARKAPLQTPRHTALTMAELHPLYLSGETTPATDSKRPSPAIHRLSLQAMTATVEADMLHISPEPAPKPKTTGYLVLSEQLATNPSETMDPPKHHLQDIGDGMSLTFGWRNLKFRLWDFAARAPRDDTTPELADARQHYDYMQKLFAALDLNGQEAHLARYTMEPLERISRLVTR